MWRGKEPLRAGPLGPRARAVGIALLAALSSACGSDSASSDAPDGGSSDGAPDAFADGPRPLRIPSLREPWFREVSKAAGLDQLRVPSEYGTLQGRMSGGVCLLDVDGDGRLDVFLPGSTSAGGSGSRLYVARGEGLHYEDQTRERGLDVVVEARGCLAFDVEGDGDLDLLVTGAGGPRLLVADGGKFVDATVAKLGTAVPADLVTTSAVAFDADGDGDLDLAIAAYGRYKNPPPGTDCVDPCAAAIFEYQDGGPLLLLQRDDGTFADATDRLGHPGEYALTLLATDLDEDGHIDLFVGNDTGSISDHYFVGDGKGSFVDRGKELGVAFGASKSGLSTMSATDADFDGDGHLDLAESSLDAEPSALFRCGLTAGPRWCRDVGDELELFRMPMPPNYRWGQAMVDLDDDGVLELVEATGHYSRFLLLDGGVDPVTRTEDRPILWHREATTDPLRVQRPDDGLRASTAGRGIAVGDLDQDGDLDLIVGTALGRPLLLENIRAPRGHHVVVRAKGTGKNPFAVGARVVVRAAARSWTHLVHAGSSFLSTSDYAVRVGVGGATRVDVEVRWPSGKVTKKTDQAVDATVIMDE